MNLPININQLLHGKAVEWERLELKEGWNPEVVLRSICAFANDFHNLGGGYIVVGIEEKDGQLVLPPKGVNPASIDAIQKEILALGHNAIMPNYHPIVFPVEYENKTVLVIWVPGGMTRPYKAKVILAKGQKDYAYYIRKNSSSVVAKGADEQELLSLTATVPFDDRYNQKARIEELDIGLIKNFLKEVGSSLANDVNHLSLEEIARAMHIVDGPSEATFPLNIGLMMFSKNPCKYFPYTQIDIVWFGSEGAGGNKFSEKIFKGPIHIMTQEALSFIERNFITETVIKHPDTAIATRVKNFPYAAIEEAVVNAVYHRDYTVREPIEIRIYEDEMLILSYPGPDRSVKLEALQKGRANSRRYRNRRIGEFLKELKMTEGRSTGINKILDAMAKNGSPKPEFEFDEEHTYFQVKLPVHEDVLKESGESVDVAVPDNAGLVPDNADSISEQEKSILDVIANSQKITSKEVEKLLGLKDRRVRVILKEMVDKGLLIKLGNARNTYYELKK